MIVILLSFSTLSIPLPPAAAPQKIDLVLPIAEPSIAPPMPRLPPGLPLAESRDGGTWLPSPRDRLLAQWLRYADAYPARIAQPLIDSERLLADYRCHEQQQITEALHRAELVSARRISQDRWGWVQTAIAIAGAFTAGAAVGILTMEFAK